MDVHAENRLDVQRRAPTDGDRRRSGERPLSEDDRIKAAQFMLGTRQREEAQLRSTHLGSQGTVPDQVRARETLAEMIHLQELITGRDAGGPARDGRDRKSQERVIDLERGTSSSRAARPVFVWLAALAVVMALLVMAVVVLTVQQMQAS